MLSTCASDKCANVYVAPMRFVPVGPLESRLSTYSRPAWKCITLSSKQRLENPANDGPKASGIPGEIFFSVFADRKLDSYEWTGEFLRLRHRIVEGVATARERPGQ